MKKAPSTLWQGASTAVGGVLLAALVWLASRSLAAPPALLPLVRSAAADARWEAALARHAAPLPCADCALRPASYHAAPLEVEWASNAPALMARGFCGQIARELGTWQAWVDAVSAVRSPELRGSKGLPQRAGAQQHMEWSYIAYSAGGAAGGAPDVRAHLEPLAGFLRDPRTSCPALPLLPAFEERTFQDSKATLYLDPHFYGVLAGTLHASAGAGRPRAFLFDLGSSSWQASANQHAAAGMSWLITAYSQLGIEFDEIFAWEAKETPAAVFFGDMPSSLVARVHFYNLPVTSSATDGGPAAALRLLRDVAQPRDFVVFKLDIDMDTLEEEITLNILESEELSALVDDFYFEHHVDTGGVMDPWWLTPHPRDTAGSIALFQALRRRGIRAHSWP